MSSKQQQATMPLGESRWILLYVWFGGTALILVPVILMCFTRSEWDGSEAKIIGWLLPNLIPTLSLIGTTIAADSINPKPDKTKVRVTFHRFVLVLSVVYIGLVGLAFVIEPAIGGLDLLAAMDVSNLWLGPIQGIVVGLVGMLFFSESSRDKEENSGDEQH